MSNNIPIACSLEGNAARLRWEEWNMLLKRRLRVERSHRSLIIGFAPDRDSWDKLVTLVASERECCGFVEWELDDLESEMTLTLRGDKEGVTAMAESFGVNV